jgi:hypothetical protein
VPVKAALLPWGDVLAHTHQSRLPWAHSIIAHVHRLHRRRMLETLVGVKQTVVRNGYAYRSLAGHDPYCQQAISECGNMYSVDLPWQLCPLTSDARQVCAGYPWASYALVLADGSFYYTEIAPKLKKDCDSQKEAEMVFMPGREACGSHSGSCLKQEGGKYLVDVEHLCRWWHTKVPLCDLPQEQRCFDVLLRRRLTD